MPVGDVCGVLDDQRRSKQQAADNRFLVFFDKCDNKLRYLIASFKPLLWPVFAFSQTPPPHICLIYAVIQTSPGFEAGQNAWFSKLFDILLAR